MIQRVRPKRSRQWNPATFYIVVFLLIGSMAINSISLRQSFETFMRQTDVRIGLLREVVERIQRGEKFDVEKALGAGNAAKEQEWADSTFFSPLAIDAGRHDC
jgi:DMSO reductase anchor subunit